MTTSIWYNPVCGDAAGIEYPIVRVQEAEEYAASEFGVSIMDFRLTYCGPLPAERSSDFKTERLELKHDIRMAIHAQLDELWKVHHSLRGLRDGQMLIQGSPNEPARTGTRLELHVKAHQCNGVNWAPLICDRFGLVCRLDILFLRCDARGGVIQTGDLDNRIKLLFDCLRIPKSSEIPRDKNPEDMPSPFFCLLEDDSLITDFRVTADRLLISATPAQSSHVQLVIKVETMIANPGRADFNFGPYL